MIDASPGVKVLIKDMNSTEPIATSKIEGKKFSGVTDEKGQFSDYRAHIYWQETRNICDCGYCERKRL